MLARFFHADRALAQVANELDSFDGRTEPDRCSRLVSRLRQGQVRNIHIYNYDNYYYYYYYCYRYCY